MISLKDIPEMYACEVAAPLYEWAEKTDVSKPERYNTFFSQLAIVELDTLS